MAPQELVDKGHGKNAPRGIKRVTRSRLHEGRFGRLFRRAGEAPELKDAELKKLADKLRGPGGGGAKLDNPKIPAAYTYFGQFVDHDITFDPVSVLQRQNDPDALTDFRSPRFDLDCVYGSGPVDQPYLYDQPKRLKLLIDPKNRNQEPDLQRNAEEVALIGDPRNDENIIVSQLQLTFLRFHNKVAALVAKDKKVPAKRKFEVAQRLVRWHYQWVILEDFLPRIVGKAAVEDRVSRSKAKGVEIDLRWFEPKSDPFMPLEFSVAAYRYGHSQIRGRYDLNGTVKGVPIFISGEKVDPLADLRGSRVLPKFWTIDWSFFLDVPGEAKKPQASRRIDANLADGLFDLPGFPDAESSLAFRNLKRGQALGLPSGQKVAEEMDLKPLTGKDLGAPAETPLWFYILKEAELGGGQQLGPVGGGIVAEVLLGLLKGDKLSFVNEKPKWRPTLGPKAGRFTLADLVRFATS
ncbi:MAG: hypothetical protein QOE75_1943 [Solirubrobacterales bacterium]|jgi:hypothetical protein|nr:hypothetical protein [Solirubrobacterales bacterium]